MGKEQLWERNSYGKGIVITLVSLLQWMIHLYIMTLANTTVTEKDAKSVVMKSTGFDKNRITVVLTAKAMVRNVSRILYFLGRNVLFKI